MIEDKNLMATVGIIPNPASGKDIRRIVTQALVMGNREKVNLVRRLLIGLHAVGVERVLIMPDSFGIGQKAIEGLRRNNGDVVAGVSLIEMAVSGTKHDTIQATQLMREEGSGCIITLGGDGTARLAGISCGEVPILPISTGTNNVLPRFIDGTVAGLCAGYLVQQDLEGRLQLCHRSKRLDIEVNGKIVDTALIDVATIIGSFTGSKAVWDSKTIRQIVVTQASPTSIGLSAVVGMITPIAVNDPFGAALKLGSNGQPQTVTAAIGPGLISDIAYENISKLQPGVRYPVSDHRPLVLALDGEREIVLQAGDDVAVYLNVDGPWLVDVEGVMNQAVENKFFIGK